MAQRDLSVIAPVYDEEANLREFTRRVLGTFARGALDGELLLVDDGSRDNSAGLVEDLVRAHATQVRGLRHATNRGIAEAWRTGLAATTAPLVAVIDSDLQYQPEDLLVLHREFMTHGVDLVQGWRSAAGRERGPRYALSRGFNYLLNATFGMRLRDIKSGFVLCPREVLGALIDYQGPYNYWQSFILVAAHAKGYRYREVEVLFEPRRQGRSFLEGQTIRAATRSVVDVTRAVSEYRHGASSARRGRHWQAYLELFPRLHWMITRDVEHHLARLDESQWWPREKLRAWQDQRLVQLVRHAYHNVPYYRRRMREAGVHPGDIRGQSDLHKLPLLTKDDVRRYLHAGLLAENCQKGEMLRISTSGSTGEPLVVYADRWQLEERWAATLRAQEWTGYRFGDRAVRLWHQALGLRARQKWQERADAAFCRRKFVPVFELSDARLGSVLGEMRDWQPVLVDGYAEALVLLARYQLSRREEPVRPRAIMSSAQTLPPSDRALVQEAFQCPVFDKYGAREFSGVAYECEMHDGHHVVEGYLVEILRDGEPVAPGETGEIVITDLSNRCLPFIRYRIGDLGVAVDPDRVCACGRSLPRIGNIEGRVQSIVQGRDGRYLPGTYFAHYLKDFDHWVRGFQVVQEEPDRIVFRLVPAEGYSEAALAHMLADFRAVLGDLLIEVELVDSLPLVHTGKRLATVSRLPIDFQQRPPARHPTASP
jgi:phenylacetate-CoA ligase